MPTTDYGIVTAESLVVKGAVGAPVNLTLRAGDRIGLLGAVGSGKQQLLCTLARLERPTGGRLMWRGVDVTRRPRRLLGSRQGDVVLIWSNPYALFRAETSPRRVLKALPARRGAMTGGLSHDLSFPTALHDTRVGALSGYQRVCLALDYVARKEVHAILIDDVFSTLNPGIWSALLARLDRVPGEEKSLLIASQYPRALARTQHILVLLNGEIVEQGPTAAVLQRPQHAYTRWLVSRPTLRSYHVRDWRENRLMRTCFACSDVLP